MVLYEGGALLNIPKNEKGLLKLLFTRQRNLSIFYLIILLLSTLLMVSLPMGVKYMLDSILIQKNSNLFVIFSIGIAIIFSFVMLLQYLKVIINNRIINNSNLFLREVILNKVKKAKVGEIETYGQGKLIQVVQKDIPVCQSVITTFIFEIIIQSLSFLFIIFFLFYLNFKLSILLVIAMTPYFLVYMNFSKKAKYINENFIIHKDHLTNSIQKIHSNYFILKKYEDKSAFFKNYIENIQNIYKWYSDQGKLKGIVTLLNGGIQILIFLIIFIYGGLLTLQSDLSIGAFVAYVMYLVTFFDPIERLMSTAIEIKASFVSIGRVVELLSLEEEDSTEDEKVHINTGNIHLNNFDLKIKNKRLLHNLNIEFTPGKFNILLGKNGVGKTTLVYHLIKLYTAPDKSIFIDEVDLNNYSSRHIRDQTAVLFQKTQFISDLIKDHLAIDSNNHVLNPIITKFVRNKRLIFKDKTYINELSGGQQQLLAFLHAIISYPKVLVVDEAFSNMDSSTKNECIQFLREIQQFTTIIFITHIDIDYTNYDTVIDLDKVYKNKFTSNTPPIQREFI